jgi:ribosomal protein S18 acetylase RimI-like enzyme
MYAIRPAEKADLLEVLRLYAQPEMDNGSVLSILEAEAIFERMQRYPDYRLYVATNNNGQIVGTFALLIMDNLGHLGSPSGIVEDVAVDPAFQGQGIGKAMMQHAGLVCKEAGCYKMMLSSNLKRTEAHAFYDSLGFERHGYSFLVQIS